jgi:hypothetical protein
VKHVSGVWTWVSYASGKVGTTAIKLPLPAAVGATLTGDVDGDGNDNETLAKELEGLTGGTVAVTTTDGVVTAFSVQSTPPPPVTPSSPPPTSPASPSPSATPTPSATKPAETAVEPVEPTTAE